MKKTIALIVFLVFTASVAVAVTLENFEVDVKKQGIEKTVDDAVKANISTDEIVEKGLAIQEINPQNLIKALYCAGLKGDEIRSVASDHNVSEMIVEAGYEKSVAECLDRLEDPQPYTPVATQRRAFNGRDNGNGKGPYASPSSP